ncbi:MAG: beta-propeller fold lactonase family protein, partial [Bryobacteraceae bacterium]
MAALVVSQPAPREQVGPLPGGGYRLVSGWKVDPAGRQTPLDTLPMSTALSPDGKFLLALNGGYNPPSISVLDVASEKETSRVPVADAWLGLAFTPKGDRVYAGGGSRAAVFEFTFSGGALSPARTFAVVPDAKRTNRDFIGDVAVSPDGRLIYAADLYRDSVAIINPQSGMIIERFKTGRRPYRILFHPDGKSLFVSSWTDGSIGHYQAETGAPLQTLRVAAHTTDMLWAGGRIFVTASNTNSVYAVSVSESKELRVAEAINVAMTPRQPLGMTPSALALSGDGKRLFVVCSDANAVAVADLDEERTRVAGFIPVGWYPTAARWLPGGRLVVLNGRGMRSYPNPAGPNPTRRPAPPQQGLRSDEYVGKLQRGSATFLDAFDAERLEQYTKAAIANSAYRDSKLDDAGTGEGNPVPSRPGDRSPIEHVIYIVKENRTYDQVLGDLKEGNGDPGLV